MKQVSVAFLFFLLFFFFQCKEKVTIKENNLNVDSKVNGLFKSSIYKKSSYRKRMNLSQRLLNEENLNHSEKYLIINNISFLYGKLKLADSAIFFAKKMLEINFYNQKKVNVYYKLGNYFNLNSQNDSAFFYYKNAKELYLQNKDSIKVGRCLLNLAIIESDFGDYRNSDISAIEGLKYLNGKREKSIIALYNCLAINSKKQQLYSQAIYNYNKTLLYKLTENQNNTIQNNIANVYKELKNYPKAISILEKLLKDSITNQKTKARIIDNLAYINWLQNSKKNILKELLSAKFIREKEKDTYGLIASYSHLSDYYNKSDKHFSLQNANKMYALSKKEKSVQDQIEAIDKIVALETPKKSLVYYKEGTRLRDSLQKVNTKRQYNFAKIKYNYEEEEKQKLKFKNQAIENKLIAEQENNQKKNILIVGLVLTAGLLFLIYRRKQQHKKQVLQENYNTETRIAKKLHDELGNGIYNIIAKVQNSNFKTDEIINDLDKVYLQTRKISHENDSVVTGNKFENYFRELITSYNSDECKIILKDISLLELNTLEKEKQIVIYRVFNELFVNMKKHSKANLVVISCKKTKNVFEITYADNGVGFANNDVILKNGLKNVETRIKSIRGNLNFDNKSAKGCKITICYKK